MPIKFTIEDMNALDLYLQKLIQANVHDLRDAEQKGLVSGWITTRFAEKIAAEGMTVYVSSRECPTGGFEAIWTHEKYKGCDAVGTLVDIRPVEKEV